MANLSFDPKEIAPFLQKMGLGQAPDTSAPDPATPPMTQGPGAPMPQVDALPPPQPTPAQAGFDAWSADPQNQKKVAGAITAPGQPLVPQAAAAQFGGVAPLNGAQTPPAAPAPTDPSAAAQSRLTADQTELNRYQDTGSGASQIKNPWLRTIARIGDAAGTILAPGVMAAVPGSTVHNWTLQNIKGAQVANDQASLQGIAQLADTQSQTNQRNAAADKSDTQADAGTPFTMTAEQAAAIGHPELVGMKTNTRDYTRALDQSGKNATSIANNQNTNQTKQSISDDRVDQTKNKPMQRDDRYIKDKQDKYEAAGLSPTAAFDAAFKDWVDTTKTAPGVARASVQLQTPTVIGDPNNPGGMVYTTRRGAIGQQAPGGIGTQVPLGVAKDFASGKDAGTLTNIRTADDHIAQLRVIAQHLNNGNFTVANDLANQYGQATGSPAPASFQLLATALASEIGKTTTGGVPTIEEGAQIRKAMNAANSPDQFDSVFNDAHQLMQSKSRELQGQYDQGMKGQPNFLGGAPKPAAPPATPPASKFSVTAPDGSVHPFATQKQADTFKKLIAGIK